MNDRSSWSRRAQVNRIGSAVVLLFAVSLSAQSVSRLGRVDLGFDPDGLLRVSVETPQGLSRERSVVNAFFDEMMAGIANKRAVNAVAARGPVGLMSTIETARPSGAPGIFGPGGGRERQTRQAEVAKMRIRSVPDDPRLRRILPSRAAGVSSEIHSRRVEIPTFVEFWGVVAGQTLLPMGSNDISGHLLPDWVPSLRAAVDSFVRGVAAFPDRSRARSNRDRDDYFLPAVHESLLLDLERFLRGRLGPVFEG